MKSSQLKLFQVQDVKTTIPVTPAQEICHHLGYHFDWVEHDFSLYGLHKLHINGIRQFSYYQASLLAKASPNP